MTEPTTEQHVINCIVASLDIPKDEVTPDKELAADFGCDSLDKLELVMHLEDKFNLNIDDKEAENINTVQQVIDLITRMQAAGGAA